MIRCTRPARHTRIKLNKKLIDLGVEAAICIAKAPGRLIQRRRGERLETAIRRHAFVLVYRHKTASPLYSKVSALNDRPERSLRPGESTVFEPRGEVASSLSSLSMRGCACGGASKWNIFCLLTG
jgi:hypothetical protein